MRRDEDEFAVVSDVRSGSRPCELPRQRRNLEYLAWLDLVRVCELIAIGVEDVHVRVGIPELLLRDLAERVTALHRIRFARCLPGRAGDLLRSPWLHLDIGRNLALPVRNRLDGIP